MIDIIIKQIQGDYITYFEEKISFLFSYIWQETKNKFGTKSLLKLLRMFKVWDMFFKNETLDRIYKSLKLQEFVSLIH